MFEEKLRKQLDREINLFRQPGVNYNIANISFAHKNAKIIQKLKQRGKILMDQTQMQNLMKVDNELDELK